MSVELIMNELEKEINELLEEKLWKYKQGSK